MTTPAHAPSAVATADVQAAMAPGDVLTWLQEGNERFTSGAPAERDLLAQASATAGGQAPLASILGCIDSRVPVEAVLDLGIGDVFVARTAGNVADDTVLGSLEFATAVAGSKVVVVLGHEACGAVKGACDGVELGHLTSLLARITPAVEQVAGEPTPGSGDAGQVARIVEQNVRNVVAELTESSDVLAGLVDDGDLVVVGAVYDLATGHIRWLD